MVHKYTYLQTYSSNNMIVEYKIKSYYSSRKQLCKMHSWCQFIAPERMNKLVWNYEYLRTHFEQEATIARI